MRSRNKDSAIGKGSGDHARLKIIRRKHGRKGLFSGVEVKWKALLITAMLALLTIFFLIYHYMDNEEMDGNSSLSIITPLPVPKITDLPQFGGEHRESLYWGTYRPQVYLGIRARTPKSLIAGLMWLAVKDSQYVLRHTCEMSDELKIYGWLRHDGRNYGHQVIVDQDMAMTTTFSKSWGNGSGYGGDWAIRFDVRNDRYPNENSLKNVHLFFYMADEGGNSVKLGKRGSTSGINTPLVSGHREDVGGWELHGKGMDNMRVHHAGFKTPHMHNLTDLVRRTLAKQVFVPTRLTRYRAIKVSKWRLFENVMQTENVERFIKDRCESWGQGKMSMLFNFFIGFVLMTPVPVYLLL